MPVCRRMMTMSLCPALQSMHAAQVRLGERKIKSTIEPNKKQRHNLCVMHRGSSTVSIGCSNGTEGKVNKSAASIMVLCQAKSRCYLWWVGEFCLADMDETNWGHQCSGSVSGCCATVYKISVVAVYVKPGRATAKCQLASGREPKTLDSHNEGTLGQTLTKPTEGRLGLEIVIREWKSSGNEEIWA